MRKLIALLLSAAAMVPAAQARTDAVEVDPADWPRYARDLGGTRFSPLDGINRGNVENLGEAWSYRLRPDGGAGLLAGTDTVLGVLPLGTANDLARTLEIPNGLAEACAVISDGKVVDIDLGRANGQPFLNVASVGLSVGVTQALSPGLKRRIGPLAYGVATVQAYARHRPFRARLEFPDGDHPTLELEDLLQVAVGNGRHYGGGNTVSPMAGIDDHTLDIYAILAAPLREHVKIARLLKDGSFVDHDRVYHLETRNVRLVTHPSMPVNLDGEIATETPTDFTVQRNAVHVVVPQGSTGATFEGSSG